MSETQAEQWVREHGDADELDDVELEEAFAAIFDRAPDDLDRTQGLWSHLCAGVASWE